MQNKKIGVIGGLGPFATIQFIDLLFQFFAKTHLPRSDQDFPEVSVEFACQTPDRTSYIIGNSKNNPLQSLTNCLERLETAEANIIAIPCNTAHFFLDDLMKCKKKNTVIVNMIEETAKFCYDNNYRKPLLLATLGTIQSKIYEKTFKKFGLDILTTNEEESEAIMDLIYNDKNGLKTGNFSHDNAEKLQRIISKYQKKFDVCILGCTELPLASSALTTPTINPMEVLCHAIIRHLPA
jgi:aspartate racemase